MKACFLSPKVINSLQTENKTYMKFIGRNFNHFDIFFLSAMMRISDPTISIKLILK